MNIDINKLNYVLSQFDNSNFSQAAFACFFIGYITEIEDRKDASLDDILLCFTESNLGTPVRSYIKRKLQESTSVVHGSTPESYRLHRDVLSAFHSDYGHLISIIPSPEKTIRERLDVSRTPLLSENDIDNAYKMAELYVAIHCLENSVRCLIREVLTNSIGGKWWDKASSLPMRRKFKERKDREIKNRWLPSRGADELNYIDWADLVTIIRKYHGDFERLIPSIKFIELRLEELENLRNTIAHNGILPDSEINRVELALSDWCKQVTILR